MSDSAPLSNSNLLRGYKELVENRFFKDLMEACAHESQQLQAQIFSEDKVDGIEGVLMREQQIGEVRALSKPERLLRLTIKSLEEKVREEQEQK